MELSFEPKTESFRSEGRQLRSFEEKYVFKRSEFIEKRNGSASNSPKARGEESLAATAEKKPFASVIIPVFREEKLLEKTLRVYDDSLRNEFDFELIVSDGGSDDRSLEIAEKYADKIVRHEESRRQTIGEGRNKGAELAEGDIFVFINADTIPENPREFFEEIRLWAIGESKYSGAAALACPVSVDKSERLPKDDVFYACHNFYVRALNAFGVGMGRGECQIVRAEAFEAAGGYDPSIAAGEDFDLYRRISIKNKVAWHPKIRALESPRRFRKFGYLKIIASWTVNALTVMLCGKSVSDEWEAVR